MRISDWSSDVCALPIYRSVALRVPAGSGDARRIEHRVAGADANPYLALATLLAGIHKGIVGEIEPGAPSDGNAALDYDDGLPFRPRRAIEKLTESCGLADYFGADYLRASAACKDAALESFGDRKSPPEYTRVLQADLP